MARFRATFRASIWADRAASSVEVWEWEEDWRRSSIVTPDVVASSVRSDMFASVNDGDEKERGQGEEEGKEVLHPTSEFIGMAKACGGESDF